MLIPAEQVPESARGELIWVDPREIKDSIFGPDVNPNASPEEEIALEQSIREEGVKVPIICERDKNGRLEVVAGTRRLRFAKKHELAKVPVIVIQFESQEAKRQYALRDNLVRRQLPLVVKATLALVLWKSLESVTNKKGIAKEGFAPRRRAAEAAGISEGTLANYRYVIDSGDQAIIDDMQSGKLKISAAFSKIKARVEGKEKADEPPPAAIRVNRVAADLKQSAEVVKALMKLAERLSSLAKAAEKCGTADKERLRKRFATDREAIAKAKTEDALGKLLDAVAAFEAGLA